MMTKSAKKAIGLILILLVGATSYLIFTKSQGQPANSSNTYSLSPAQRGAIQSIVTSEGTLEPKTYVDVGAQISGQIKKLHVNIGDTVKAGDLLAEIDSKTYESVVTGDEAQLAQLEAQRLEKLASLKKAERDVTRYASLIKEQAISKLTLDEVKTNVEIAKAQLSAVEAQIKQQQSTLEKNRTNLTYTKIFAPIDGTVVTLPVKEGETVNANQTTPTIGRVANLDIMTAEAQVAEADIGKLKDGMNVYFTTLGSDGRKWQGKIRQILPTPETVNDVVLYNILVDVDNTDRALMTGMTTQMFFEKGAAQNVLTIPAEALLRRDSAHDSDKGQAYIIKVPDSNNQTPIEKTITIGLTDRSSAEVTSGLDEGEMVIVPGAKASTTLKKDTPPRMPGGL